MSGLPESRHGWMSLRADLNGLDEGTPRCRKEEVDAGRGEKVVGQVGLGATAMPSGKCDLGHTAVANNVHCWWVGNGPNSTRGPNEKVSDSNRLSLLVEHRPSARHIQQSP
jgi:hypothetical protein